MSEFSHSSSHHGGQGSHSHSGSGDSEDNEVLVIRKQYEARIKKMEHRMSGHEEENHRLGEEIVALKAKCFKLEEEVRHHKVPSPTLRADVDPLGQVQRVRDQDQRVRGA